MSAKDDCRKVLDTDELTKVLGALGAFVWQVARSVALVLAAVAGIVLAFQGVNAIGAWISP